MIGAYQPSFISAILLTITLILVGYIFTKNNLFKSNPSQILSSLVMKVCLPCLAFVGFMSNFEIKQIGIFVISFIGFGILFLLGRLLFIKTNKDDFDLCRICFALGQVSLFGLPIAKAIFEDTALTTANMVLLSFRLYLYIYAYLLIKNEKLTKDNFKESLKKTFLNPIMIAMLIGLLFYLSQLFIPTITIGEKEGISIFRIDETLPIIYSVIKSIGDLSVPLSMILVGASLAKINIKDALINGKAWYISISRSFIAPTIIFLMLLLYQLIFKNVPSMVLEVPQIIIIVLLFGAPTSVTVNTMAVENNRNSVLTSDSVLLTTLLSLVSYPIILFVTRIILLSIQG